MNIEYCLRIAYDIISTKQLVTLFHQHSHAHSSHKMIQSPIGAMSVCFLQTHLKYIESCATKQHQHLETITYQRPSQNTSQKRTTTKNVSIFTTILPLPQLSIYQRKKKTSPPSLPAHCQPQHQSDLSVVELHHQRRQERQKGSSFHSNNEGVSFRENVIILKQFTSSEDRSQRRWSWLYGCYMSHGQKTTVHCGWFIPGSL